MHEAERDGCNSSLDVRVVKVDRGLETGLFRKETFTGLSTKYNSTSDDDAALGYAGHHKLLRKILSIYQEAETALFQIIDSDV